MPGACEGEPCLIITTITKAGNGMFSMRRDITSARLLRQRKREIFASLRMEGDDVAGF